MQEKNLCELFLHLLFEHDWKSKIHKRKQL